MRPVRDGYGVKPEWMTKHCRNSPPEANRKVVQILEADGAGLRLLSRTRTLCLGRERRRSKYGSVEAIDVSGVSKVHAVVGGFHLFAADDDYVRKTVAELKQLDPDVVIPMHCSGPTFVQVTREQMPDRLITSTTGTEYTFGA